MVFMLAAVHNLELDQIDIRAAYLNTEIDVPIYMKKPKGYEKGNLVCKLNKALYGTKQAGRAWQLKVDLNLLCTILAVIQYLALQTTRQKLLVLSVVHLAT
jgi:hypothetical protein